MDSFGRNEIHNAILDYNENQHYTLIERLISNGIDPNLQDNNGWSPLHFACQENSEQAVLALIKNKVLIDLKDQFGNTPLFKAVFSSKGQGNIIKLLLEAGANANSVNKNGVSPQTLASSIGNYNVHQFFI